MAEKLAWLEDRAQHLRRLVMCEPRGHAGMRGAVLTEPVQPEAHAGLLFMDADGFYPCSFESAMAAAAVAIECGVIGRRADESIVFDTAVGVLRVAIDGSVRQGAGASLTACPAFVLRGGVDISALSRRLRADLAFGGAFYAIVDSEAAGVPIDGSRDAELRRTARALAEAIAPTQRLTHPLWPHIGGLRGVVFTAPAQRGGADFRMVVVTLGGRVSRGTSGTGLAAVLSVLDAMGLPLDEQGVTLEGAVGSRLHARIANRAQVGDVDAIVPVVQGTVWLTGEHTFLASDDDPFKEGFASE